MTVPLLLRYYPRLMPAMRSRGLAHCIALFMVAFASCSDRGDAVDAPIAAGRCISCAGDDAGGASSGGKGPSVSGGTSTNHPTAGKAGSTTGGTSADAGVGNTPGGEAGSGATGPISEELALCDRLTQVDLKEEQLSDEFERSMWLDCRVHWLPDLYVHPAQGPQVRDEYVNALARWNLRFWGCEDVPVETFELVWGEPRLSQGDADIIIDYYMQEAIQHLQLSPKEQGEMLAALKRLSTLLITSDSLEPSNSICSDGNAGGDGPGGAGNAGEPARGGVGNLGGAP